MNISAKLTVIVIHSHNILTPQYQVECLNSLSSYVLLPYPASLQGKEGAVIGWHITRELLIQGTLDNISVSNHFR